MLNLFEEPSELPPIALLFFFLLFLVTVTIPHFPQIHMKAVHFSSDGQGIGGFSVLEMSKRRTPMPTS